MANKRLSKRSVFFTVAALVALMIIGLNVTDIILALKNSSPKPEPEPQEIVVTGYQALSEEDILLMALMWTESKFNPGAYDGQGSVGILQIRQIYVNEVNRILGKDKYTLDDALSVEKSLEMFEILQNYHNPKKDFSKTIYYHNKSEAYETRVIKTYNTFLAYEKMREKLLKIQESSLDIEE